MLYFIRVFTVYKGKVSSDKSIQYIFEKLQPNTLDIYNGLTQARRKNPSVNKGLNFAKLHDTFLMCMISQQNVEVLAACQRFILTSHI